jgi:hypothetical protein
MTTEEIEQLKAHSHMLGRIASYLEDFCESDEDTTLVCVLRLLARYHSLEADSLFDAIRDEQKRD